MKAHLSRRQFVNRSIAELASLSLARLPRRARSAEFSPRVRFGIIGVGGRGTNLMKKLLDHPGAEIRTVCDLSIYTRTKRINQTQ